MSILKLSTTWRLFLITVFISAMLAAIPGCERLGKFGTGNRPNVLLITLDTTRADRLGCYGYQSIETPVMDRLAREGVRFERTYASSPITLPNHASILTGTHTLFHGARNNGTYQVDPSITTAAEMYSVKGYTAAAFIASFPLLARFGLDQGFKVYDDRIEEGKEKRTFLFQERRASDVNKAVMRWLNKKPEGPLFVWVHYFDPHFSYEPPSPFKEKYFFSPYDGEIAYTDSQIGELVEAFRNRGLLDNTIVAITADHGESLGEHNEKTHAILIYYGTVRVPLILWYPKVLPAGKVVVDTVRSIDILPTLLDYSGIPIHEDIQGVSLRPLIEGKRESLDLVAYTETLAPYLHFYWSPLEGIRTGGYLYIKADPEELYNLNQDSMEVHDLSATEPKKLAQMRAIFKKEKTGIINPNELKSEVKLDAETQERLRALGYIFGSTVEPKSNEKLKNPRFMVQILEAYNKGQSALAAEHYEKAIEIFDGILEKEPNFGRAVLEKGLAYFRLKKYEKAIENYNRAEEMLPGTAELYFGRARCYAMLENIEEAEKDYLKVLAIDSTKSTAYIMLSKIKFRQKDIKAGHKLLLKAVEANHKSEMAHFELARFYRIIGKIDEAKNEFLLAKNSNPNFPLAPYWLGKLHREAGEIEYAIANLEEAIRRSPKFVQAHALLAQIYIDQDSLNRAEAHLDIALALDPNSDAAHFSRGNLLVKKGKMGEAFVEFRKAVELNPKNALAHKNLGSCYAILGVPEKAIEHYRLSLELMPRQAQAEKIRAAIKDLEQTITAVKKK